ncbi:MAG: hypothetical protein MUO31_13255 [Thermodesulfovibrionales bacterium]|nr:hypothetical protein [Thermodesulfovibrionales bacterium]
MRMTDVKRLIAKYEILDNMYIEQCKRFDKLKASHDKLVEYADHKYMNCGKWILLNGHGFFDNTNKCTCGLEQALAEAKKIGE